VPSCGNTVEETEDEAAEGAHILWGFNQDVSADTVRRAIQQGTLEDYVNVVPVQAGDVIYNPAGTLHAIGAGIILFEIQQSSDLTYRVYDYHRRDAAGNLRELHLDKALAVLDLQAGEQAKVAPKQRDEQTLELIRVDAFAMELWQLAGQRSAHTDTSSLEILTLIAGDGMLSSPSGELTLTTGMSVVLPASLGDYQLNGNASLLRCFLPA
jgi:mannose-6-phosphate isomerase